MSLARLIASSSDLKVWIDATGPKISSSQHLGVVRHVGQHGRRIEEAGPVRRLAAGQHFGALCHRVVDQLDHLVAAFFVDQRAERDALVEAVAHLERRHLVGELFGEFVVHLLVHIEAVRRRAGLAHVAHLGDHRALDRGVDVGVLEHDERRVAAQFHRGLDDIVGGLMQQLAADLGRAGERHHAHARIVQHRATHLAGASATE